MNLLYYPPNLKKLSLKSLDQALFIPISVTELKITDCARIKQFNIPKLANLTHLTLNLSNRLANISEDLHNLIHITHLHLRGLDTQTRHNSLHPSC